MLRRIYALLTTLATLALIANPMPDEEAAELLKEYAKSSRDYVSRTGQTRFFSRAQLKYGLERSDYLARWCDRPLMQDTRYANAGSFSRDTTGSYQVKGFLNPHSWQVETNLLKRFNFSGFAFFPELTGRADIYNRVGTPGSADILILPELFYQHKMPTMDEIEQRVAIAEAALKCPYTFRINGKVVITSYPATESLDFWIELKKQLKAKFGDQFLFMPWTTIDYGLRPSGKNKHYTVADIEKMCEKLRTSLRALDGLYYNTPPFYNRRYQWAFDREVIIPIIHKVMNEPEFRGKYLGWGVKVAHMNCHHQPFAIESYGTDTLRGTIEAAILAKADFINCVEWDEENENTCFRPMTATGFSTLRLCRAFEQLANGKPFSPLPDDDLAIPNLVLSYPRVLAAGQNLEFEIANIPDGTGKDNAEVELLLTDNNGQTVHSFPRFTIDRRAINARVVSVSSETLLASRFLNPVIIVDGKRFDRGFQPIEIRAWWHWDYLWTKHVLRDMPQQINASLTFSRPDANGLLTATVDVSSPLPLRSVEIISGDNVVVYSHSATAPEFRETADTAAFRVSCQAMNNNQLVTTGTIRILNAPDAEVDPRPSRFQGDAKEWKLTDALINHWPLHRYLKMPRAQAEQAVIEINLPGFITGKQIRLADVLTKGAIGIGGDFSANIVVARSHFQYTMPEPLMTKNAAFQTTLCPDLPESSYYLQIVDEQYRIYRSHKTTAFVPSDRKVQYHVFSIKNNAMAPAETDADLLKPLTYDFSDARGSILTSSLGHRLDAILAGFVPLATGFGQGETIYGNSTVRYIKPNDEAYRHAAPKRERDGDRDVLVFSGAQYVSLPLGIIPPYAGYEIEMDVFPAPGGDKEQTLLTDTRDAFTLQLVDGVPIAFNYLNQLIETLGGKAMTQAKGPALQPGQWNKITVQYDQQTCQVIVNGVPGEAVPCSGYHRYPRATLLGASERGSFFTGKIASLKITPR